MQSIKNNLSSLFFFIGLLFLSAFNSLYHPLNFDEGVNTLIVHFLNQGFQPYTDIYISRTPLFVNLLQTAFWGGENIIQARLFFFLLGGIFVALLGMLTNEFFKEKKIILMGWLLITTSPLFITLVTKITDDIPSITLANLSILLMLLYLRKNSLGWLWAAGIALALNLSAALLIYLMIINSLLLLTQYLPVLRWTDLKTEHRTWGRRLFIEIIVFLVGVATILLFNRLFFDWNLTYQLILKLKLTLRSVLFLNLAANSITLLHFWANTSTLIMGMVIALFKEKENPRHVVWFLFLWWVLAAGYALAFQVAVIMLPPMILISGWGYWCLLQQVVTFAGKQAFLPKNPWWVYGIFLVLAVLWGVTQTQLSTGEALTQTDVDIVEYHRLKAEMLDFVVSATNRDDCVITDDPVFALQANRFPPPELGDPSLTRIRAGDLTLDTLQQSIQNNHCTALVSVNELFSRQNIPGIWDWAESYFPQKKILGDLKIYYE